MTSAVSRFTTAAEFMTTFTGEIHPIADYFALLPEDELQELADDIAANGLQHPIILDAEGRLLDGRNRLHACERAGVEPTFTVRSDINGDKDSPKRIARLIRSNNNRRRNQSTGQQAATDALLLDAEGLRKGGRWAREALTQDSALPRGQAEAMRQAGFILDHHRALLIEVAKGAVAISTAQETLDLDDLIDVVVTLGGGRRKPWRFVNDLDLESMDEVRYANVEKQQQAYSAWRPKFLALRAAYRVHGSTEAVYAAGPCGSGEAAS